MIETFKHKGLKALYENDSKKGVTPHISGKLKYILDLLNAAAVVDDMNYPGARLHPWKGGNGVWSVDVSGNWRIIFQFSNGKAYDVDLIDPH
ncbi:MAG: type II toxin-antitoxin system RelE/ParE family toxin [Nitrospirae bacterium]|nr:type II toxin-antitoxin system RelE/ParE family toxin [Magnetococcales bacterium]HAT50350.1 peptidase [Alphaproteobacteria bacterium]